MKKLKDGLKEMPTRTSVRASYVKTPRSREESEEGPQLTASDVTCQAVREGSAEQRCGVRPINLTAMSRILATSKQYQQDTAGTVSTGGTELSPVSDQWGEDPDPRTEDLGRPGNKSMGIRPKSGL